MRSPSALSVDVRDGQRVFCSTIIPTIGRPTLARAVESVLAQLIDGEDFEVIVVNDSGGPLAEADWQRSKRVRVIATDRQERSVARNSGASLATGRYLHFLDDDDALLPQALRALLELSRRTDAAWLYGSYLTVDNDGTLVREVPAWVEGNISAKLMVRESIPPSWRRSVSAFVAAGAAVSPGPSWPPPSGTSGKDRCGPRLGGSCRYCRSRGMQLLRAAGAACGTRSDGGPPAGDPDPRSVFNPWRAAPSGSRCTRSDTGTRSAPRICSS